MSKRYASRRPVSFSAARRCRANVTSKAAETGFAAASPARSPSSTSRHHCSLISPGIGSRARSRIREISMSKAYSENRALRLSTGANNVARYRSRSNSRTRAAQYLSFLSIQTILAPELRDSDQACSDTAVFSQKDVERSYGCARWHCIDRQREIAKPSPQIFGQDPRISTRTNQEKIEGLRPIKCR